MDHDLLYSIARELRGGVIAAFGVTIGICLLGLSVAWKGRAAGGLFIALFLAVLWIEFRNAFCWFTHWE